VSRPVPALPDWYDRWLAQVPSWARSLADGETAAESAVGGVLVTAQRGVAHLLAAGAVCDACRLTAPQLEAAVADVYRGVLTFLHAEGFHPLRFWNFIPGILDPLDAGLTRYMHFNVGRAAGYQAVYSAHDLPAAIATASGVGVDGTALLVGCFASTARGIAVENPRQVPAYRYSIRYGPTPPSFARAMLADDSRLLIGGTAAVRGEDSVEPGNVAGQLRETIVNLESLVTRASAMSRSRIAGQPLTCLTSARVYVVEAADATAVHDGLRAAGLRCGIEHAVATLCRPDLLVEVEGTASLIAETPEACPPA
jgi:chorismate lyase/3-hydroxybenzoate synthase